MDPVSMTGEVPSSFGTSSDLDLGHWVLWAKPGRVLGRHQIRKGETHQSLSFPKCKMKGTV